MPKQCDSFNARVTRDASEGTKQEASTSFDYTRFLVGSKAKSEETQATATAREASYTQNTTDVKRDFKIATLDQQQHAKDPKEKVILAHDYSKGGTKEEAKEFLKDLKERNKPKWDAYQEFINARNDYQYQEQCKTYQDSQGRTPTRRAIEENPEGYDIYLEKKKIYSRPPRSLPEWIDSDSER